VSSSAGFLKSRSTAQGNRQAGRAFWNQGGTDCFKAIKSLKDNAVVVEIGAYKGKSTCFIAEGLKGISSTLYMIDTWFNDGGMRETRADTFPEFLMNISSWRDNIVPLRGFSAEVRKTWPSERKIDFLWIDGDHSYEGVKRDIDDWLPLVKNNCFVCFHDYREYPGVKKAVDEKILEGEIKPVKKQGNIFLTKKP
jgi:predicted O-methyltransferase YrrM